MEEVEEEEVEEERKAGRQTYIQKKNIFVYLFLSIDLSAVLLVFYFIFPLQMIFNRILFF